MNETSNIYYLMRYGINTTVRICDVSQLPPPLKKVKKPIFYIYNKYAGWFQKPFGSISYAPKPGMLHCALYILLIIFLTLTKTI